MERNYFQTRLICPLTAGDISGMCEQLVRAIGGGAEIVEIRLDYLEQPPSIDDLRRLVGLSTVPLIVTCRPVRQGGRYAGKESDRLAMLKMSASSAGGFADVECDVEQADWPGGKVILSHHDFARRPGDLMELARRLDDSQADVNKIAFQSSDPADALAALDVVRTCRKPTICLAMGESGLLSRLSAGKVGAFGTFAALDAQSGSAPGQPTLRQFREVFRWGKVNPSSRLFGVIGCPLGHSLSPVVHNAAFDALGLDGLYVPLLIEPGADRFNRVMDALLERPWLDWRGLSVTIPHKENALAYVGAENCDKLAVSIGAVNTITIDQAGRLRGDNTDYPAALDCLCDALGVGREELQGLAVTVLGAGGVGRAVVAGLRHYGADVTICNRTIDRAGRLAEEFNCRAGPLDSSSGQGSRVIVNCTSLGMHPQVEQSPICSIPAGVEVVFDTIYNPVQTRLIQLARLAGCRTVSGAEMFVNQAANQFELWWDRRAPKELMRRVVLENLCAERQNP